jgi:hypothetical protein
MEYFDKYIKYKIKYLNLKYNLLQKGGDINSSNEELFAEKQNVDYSKLKITPEGEYSITKRKDGKILLNIMKSILKNTKNKVITDLTGNVGGDTILFGLNFKKVHSIEINDENFQALENNINVFKLKNVNLYFGDSTKLYDWHTDILYLDAPWGGKDYRKHKLLDLYLGSIRIDEFLEEVVKRNNSPKYIFLKVPYNYNFDRLNKLGKVKKYKIRNYYIISIFVKK